MTCVRTLKSNAFFSIPRAKPGSMKEDSLYTPMAYMPIAPEKRSPIVELDYKGRFASMKSRPRTDIETKQVYEILSNDTDWIKVWKDHPEEVSNCILGPRKKLPRVTEWLESEPNSIPAGKIGFIQEGGAKLRAVANPSLVIQALGQPLKKRLEMVSHAIRSIYTHDQRAGQLMVSRWLSKGRTVFSFDASAFTDRFPYRIQQSALKRLKEYGWVSQFDIDVFDTVIAKDWVLPADGGRIRWKVGQPMGFGPSFHLATVSHHLVVDVLARRLRLPTDEYCVIVGDDIAISNKDLAEAYHKFMVSIGVEINLQKSMISDKYAEFCGKVISAKGINPSTKVKEITNQSQLLKSIEFYGRRGLYNLTQRQQQWALKAILPRDVGGLGITPEGMTYTQYLTEVLDVDRLQRKYLRENLREALEPISQVTLEGMLSHAAEFYDLIDLSLSEQEYKRLFSDDNVYVSAWSGFPENKPGTSPTNDSKSADARSSQRTKFADLVDNVNRQELNELGDALSHLPEDATKFLHGVTGEFHDSEKRPKRPISVTTKQKDFYDEESKFDTGMFTQWFQPSTGKTGTGYTKEDLIERLTRKGEKTDPSEDEPGFEP
nr:TPA_asm: RdRp [Polycarpa mytiligera associated mitovirus 1]